MPFITSNNIRISVLLLVALEVILVCTEILVTIGRKTKERLMRNTVIVATPFWTASSKYNSFVRR